QSSLQINIWKNPEDRLKVVNELHKNGYCNNFEAIFKRKDGTELIGLMSAKIITLQDNPHIISITREITEFKKVEDEIRKLNEELELRVTERTLELEKKSFELNENQSALLNIVEDLNDKSNQLMQSSLQLEQSNKELEAFSYSVSHDLRAPLRSIDGFSLALYEDYFNKLDDKAKDYLYRIRNSTTRMDELIDSMLKLSRVTRFEIRYVKLDLSSVANEILDNLKITDNKRVANFIIQKDVIVEGDAYLLRILLENLFNNAWKFTSKNEKTVIELRTFKKDTDIVYFIKDNGTGFDMKYYNKLFGAFQRLHSKKEYPGTGIGLATVQRIIHRHNGKIWAESEIGKGTTFYFTLK
ncbi:MAG: ATP-binding protein, partial [Ignavibacteriae bacterium]|nr:ATP-binding protein [Ignavibacteriota bacterium]